MSVRSKLLIAAAAVVTALAFVAAVGAWRTGARRLTVLVNGAPAAGAELERMGPHGMETLLLDEQGSLDLAWGFSEPHPLVLFRAGEDRTYQLQLPAFGQREYRVWSFGITREDTVVSLGPLRWRKTYVQQD